MIFLAISPAHQEIEVLPVDEAATIVESVVRFALESQESCDQAKRSARRWKAAFMLLLPLATALVLYVRCGQ